ncbi:hypothetical protein EON64_02810 [archaeon]|nr:MAG: hypothetical protein EON64_02810 [archaeon]
MSKRGGGKRRNSDNKGMTDMVVPPPPPSPMIGGTPSSGSTKSGRKAMPDSSPPLASPSGKEGSLAKRSMSVTPGRERPPVFLTPEDATGEVFENDYDLITLRAHVTVEFKETFKEAIQNYLDGQWAEAKVRYRECIVSISALFHAYCFAAITIVCLDWLREGRCDDARGVSRARRRWPLEDPAQLHV